MFLRLDNVRLWPAGVGFVCCLCSQVGYGATPIADPDTYLNQTQALATTDHPRFLKQLALLNQEASTLTRGQWWHLRYSNAWEAMYESDYAKSDALYKDIIQHSGNPALIDRASAMLLSQYGITRHYTEAFELANRVAARLPKATDAKVRLSMMMNLSLSLGLAGQTDLAVHYARMAMAAVTPGDSRCYPVSDLVVALFNAHRLKSDSPELQQAFAACPASSEPVFNADLWLTLIDLYVQEGKPRKALALLDRTAREIDVNGYVPNKLSALVERAKALAAVGDDDGARKAALAVIAAGKPDDIGAWLKDTYQVLYRIENRQGHAAAALGYYKKYAALDKAYLDDVNARAIAYQTVQQHLLAQKLETEKLGRQNALLRVRQARDAQKAEANRLYLALLLMALAFAALWMFRLRRSQLRFKQLSHLDGLTATFNRQHFMTEVERTLRLLEKRAAVACLVFIDLDHFKQVNDTHGHAMGDEVLRHIVAVCRRHLRTVDLFGRLGGEEFGILLAECSRTQGVAIAERIRLAVEAARVEKDGVIVGVSASVGVAFTDIAGYDAQRLCKEADAALYRAKRGGRNRVVADAADDDLVEA
jgi:diguanylate cyclase (GGDEF)-like protein